MAQPFDRRDWCGAFDIIGDVHGCADELEQLLTERGYARHRGVWRHPSRRALFVGDLVNRGPDDLRVVEQVRTMIEAGHALCSKGNHDKKTARWAVGAQVQLTHGLERTVAQVAAAPDPNGARTELGRFLGDLPPYLWLDGGRLVVVHAGLRSEYIGRLSRRIEAFALYGDVERVVDGRPLRRDWARAYRARAFIVYGHTPHVQPYWCGNTVNIDTGAVFGGRLSCLLWPEREIVSIPVPQYAAGEPAPLPEYGQEKCDAVRN